MKNISLSILSTLQIVSLFFCRKIIGPKGLIQLSWVCFFFSCMSLVWMPSALSATEDEKPLQIAQQLADHLSSLDSLSFTFTQRTMGQMSGRPRQASGQAYFAKTDEGAKVRWNYQTPDSQVILSDGTTLIMYFSNLNQMIVAPADTLQQDITYSFFTGQSDLHHDFIVKEGPEPEETSEMNDYASILLVPRETRSQIKDIRLWILDTTQIKRIEIRDTFDTVTLLNLSNIKENSLTASGKLIDEDFFQFTPPEGTEIIHQ